MWRFGIALCLCLVAQGFGDNVRLRVTVRKGGSRFHSCTQSVSQMELLNTDPTVPLVIHSMTAESEKTYLIRNGERLPVEQALPKQLFVPPLPTEKLVLGEKQMAIVPLSFAPKFPQPSRTLIQQHHQQDTDEFLSDYHKDYTPMGKAAYRDLEAIVGVETLHNYHTGRQYQQQQLQRPQPTPTPVGHGTVGDLYEVHAILVIDTNQGALRVPVKVASIRQNDYGVPEYISLREGLNEDTVGILRLLAGSTPEPNLPSPEDSGVQIIDTATDEMQQARQTAVDNLLADCYDVHLDNPQLDKELLVTRVQITRPDLVSITLREGEFIMHQEIYQNYQGEIRLPPGAQHAYVFTVCPLKVDAEKLTKDIPATDIGKMMETDAARMDKSPSLGSLIIRTDKDNLIIGLERAELDGDVQDQLLPTSNDSATSIRQTVDPNAPEYPSFTAFPVEGNLSIVPSHTSNATVPIGFRNTYPHPLRLMRSTAFAKITKDNVDMANEIGLDLSVFMGSDCVCDKQGSCSTPETDTSTPYDMIIPRASSVNQALVFRCSIAKNTTMFEKGRNPGPVTFTATLVIRATSHIEKTWEQWREITSRDPFGENDLVLEIAFSIRIQEGEVHLTLDDRSQLPSTSLIYDEPVNDMDDIRSVKALFFPMERQDKNREITYPLRVVSPWKTPLSLSSTQVNGHGKYCQRFSVTYSANSTDGSLTLTYKYGRPSSRDAESGNPEQCYFQFLTAPIETGLHIIRLIVFPGSLTISTSEGIPGAEDVPDDSIDFNSNTSGNGAFSSSLLVGLDSVVNWLKTSELGFAFKKLLNRLETGSSSVSADLLSTYLRNISPGADDSRQFLRPILLNVGAVGYGGVKTTPLYLTNRNPVPVTVTVDVGDVEGMSIALSRDQSSGGHRVMDYLLQSEVSYTSTVQDGEWRGHPMAGLRQFLVSSDWGINRFFSELRYRDAVYPSQLVEKDSFIRELFQKDAVASFHADSIPVHLHQTTSNCPGLEQHPPEYFESGGGDWGSSMVPLIFSDDLDLIHPHTVCQEMNARNVSTAVMHAPVTIPPGGVARFDIKVRAPPYELLERDVTPFVSTGLTLSTDRGDTMPIIATFEALLGQLRVSTNREESSPPRTDGNIEPVEIIEVPPGLFSAPAESVTHHDVPLFVSSSFSRDIKLTEIESCNPWFEVDLEKNDSDPTLLGSLRNEISCDHWPNKTMLDLGEEGDKGVAFPSFFACAANWLKNREKIQPRGCGLRPSAASDLAEEGTDLSFDNFVVDRATDALSRAIYYAYAYQDPDPEVQAEARKVFGVKEWKRTNGFVPRLAVDTFAEAFHAWDQIAELGMHIVSSDLRATVDYSRTSEKALVNTNTASENEKQNITVSINNLAVQTVLRIPSLIDSDRLANDGDPLSHEDGLAVVQFPSTRVADVSSLMIPIRNPTAVPVKVRLASVSLKGLDEDATFFDDFLEKRVDDEVRDKFLSKHNGFYVQSGPSDLHHNKGAGLSWWEGDGAFFLSDEKGDLIQSQHNKTTVAGPAAHVSFLNPALHATNTFLLGCEARCAIRRDHTKPKEDIPYTHGDYSRSTIGASASFGRRMPPGLAESDTGGSIITSPPAFAIPYSSLNEVELAPFASADLGPILFRPPGRSGTVSSKGFESMIFLENTLTGLERVVVQGKGVLEEVIFLDEAVPEDGPETFGDIEHRFGFPTLVFPGSGSVAPTAKQVLIHNPGDIPISFDKIHFSTKSKLLDTLEKLERVSPSIKEQRKRRATHTGGGGQALAGCSVNGFELVDCNDEDISQSEERETNLLHGFDLGPGENRSISIRYFPECMHRTDFVSLVFSFKTDLAGKKRGDALRPSRASRRNSPFVPRFAELVVGVDMTERELARCVPVRGASSFNSPTFSKPDLLFNRTKSGQGVPAIGGYLSFGRDSIKTRILAGGFFVTAIWAIVLSVALVTADYVSRRLASRQFQGALRGQHVKTRAQNEAGKSEAKQSRTSDYSNWPAAFRCLARSDPTSAELHVFGREQAKQVVVSRYIGAGMNPPQCVSSAGIFCRDRSIVAAASRAGGSAGGNEKVVTVSDALFQGSAHGPLLCGADDGLVSCSLGWRAAVSRGVVSKKSRMRHPLKSTQILKKRRSAEEARRPAAVPSVEKVPVTVVEDIKTSPVKGKAMVTQKENGLPEKIEADKAAADSVSTSDSEATAGASTQDDSTASPAEPTLVSEVPVVNLKCKSPSFETPAADVRVSSREAEKYVRVGPKTSSSKQKAAASEKKTRQQRTQVSREKDKPETQKRVADTTKPAEKQATAKQDRTASTAVAPAGKSGKGKVSKKAGPAAATTKPNASAGSKTAKKTTPSVEKEAVKPKEKGRKKKELPPRVKRDTTSGSVNSASSSSTGKNPSSTGKKKRPNAPGLTLSASTESDAGSGVRPPPGLAPPPGFGQSAGSGKEERDSSLRSVSHKRMGSDVPHLDSSSEFPPLSAPSPPIQESSPSLFPTADLVDDIQPFRIASSSVSASSPRVTPKAGDSDEGMFNLSPTEPSERPLLGQESNFNVMDFLDSILEDPNASSAQAPELVSNIQAPELAQTTKNESLAPVPLTLDPWAAERKSRATAYGISVEESNDNVVQASWTTDSSPLVHQDSIQDSVSSSLSNSVPLLTPAAILSVAQDEQEDDLPDFSRGGSFYASLLRE